MHYANVHQNLFVYIDFHAHASKKGCFMFGNHLSSDATEQHPNSEQVENILLSRLISLNTANFDINECNFSEKIMNVKDKSGQSREGSSRVSINKDSKIRLVHCYTLESNYHNGRRVNHLAPRTHKSTGAIEAETPVTDLTSKIY
jgi:cytosolic carboxypeptidase protein 5